MAILLDMNAAPELADPYLRAVLDKAAKDSAEGYHSWALAGLQVAFDWLQKNKRGLVHDDIALVSRILTAAA